MYSHILIPTDGSPLAETAVEKGVEFAKDAGARVTMVTVTKPFRVFSGDSSQIERVHDEFDRYTRESAVQILKKAAHIAKARGVPCDTVHVEDGIAYQAIIDTAKQKHCDLIAMATHGKGGVQALLLGSVTLKVLTYSLIPVLVYR